MFLQCRNHTILKSNVIYRFRTTTLMNDTPREITILKGRICRIVVLLKTSETRHSNGNIMFLQCRNHAIQKSRVIYRFRTTTLMNDPPREITVLKRRICRIVVRYKQAKLHIQTGISCSCSFEIMRFKNPVSYIDLEQQL